mmetsp:Transcript_12110/g.39472  ORF Transcript_12110/g.39472 Transcript_12110/m.39472 type:complete len:134 (-) Transcript_12110:1263-1664(-)
MVRFSNSEVVPLYFCFFSVGGVYGAALAYDELCWPGVLLLLPGLALCIGGVFCISYRREARVARLRAAAGGGGGGGSRRGPPRSWRCPSQSGSPAPGRAARARASPRAHPRRRSSCAAARMRTPRGRRAAARR